MISFFVRVMALLNDVPLLAPAPSSSFKKRPAEQVTTNQKKNDRRIQREVLELEQCRRGPGRSRMPHLRYLMTDQKKQYRRIQR